MPQLDLRFEVVEEGPQARGYSSRQNNGRYRRWPDCIH
jgi:hypothetical protein